MPAFFVLKERDAGPLEGLGEDDQGLGAQADRGEHLEDFFDIVAIDFLGAPAEGLEALLVSVEVVAKGGGSLWPRRLTSTMAIEVVQLMIAGQRSGLPHRAFRAFAIAEQNIGAVVQAIHPGAQGHADPHAQPLAERAGRYVHKRQARRRMALEVRPELAELEQVLHREKTGFSPSRVKEGCSMAF